MHLLRNYLRGAVHAWLDYPLRTGLKLGEAYEVVRFLGMGSYGLAYLCSDRQTGTFVVVKQARPSKGDVARQLLLREEEALRAMDDARIPKWLGRIERGKKLFLVIKWIDGSTVEDLIFEQGRGFTEAESLRLAARLVPVVAYVHEKGWVHLDVRIPNVMWHEGDIKLIDFGLARRIGDAGGLEAFDYEEEQRRRTPEVQSDWYAVGHFLLFLLYSSYEAKKEQPPGTWYEELSLSPYTVSLLRRLLQLDPPYADVCELLQDLDKALADVELR